MHPTIVQLGPFELRFYGVMYVVAILVGRWLVRREVLRKGLPISAQQLDNFVLLVVLLGIVFGRAYYVVFNWSFYAANPWEIPAVWHGGLAIHGGILGGVLAGLWMTRRWGVSFWSFADMVAPSVILGQAFGRFGNFMNGDAHGIPTTLPWGVRFAAGTPAWAQFGEVPLHPTMLYEMMWNLLLFFILIRTRRLPAKPGFIFLLYLVGYSVGRFFVSFLRADSLMLGPFRAAQLVSLVLIAAMGLVILRQRMWTP